MRKSSSVILLFLTLAVAGGIVAVVVWKSGQPRVVERIGFQDADFLLGMPSQGEVDHRFQFVGAWQAGQIPLALRFDPPMGADRSGLVYNAQKFWEMNEARGGHHTGDDLNGIGGMNTDLGDPVYSTADGLVLYAGEPSAGWGLTVVIAHKGLDGKTLHSMYAHLQRIDVTPGALVSRGGQVGTVGTANGYYPAHLHFEMRESDEVDIGAGYGAVPLNRIDAVAAVAARGNADVDDLSPSPLGLAFAAGPAPWTTLEIQGAEKIPGLLNGEAD